MGVALRRHLAEAAKQYALAPTPTHLARLHALEADNASLAGLLPIMDQQRTEYHALAAAYEAYTRDHSFAAHPVRDIIFTAVEEGREDFSTFARATRLEQAIELLYFPAALRHELDPQRPDAVPRLPMDRYPHLPWSAETMYRWIGRMVASVPSGTTDHTTTTRSTTTNLPAWSDLKAGVTAWMERQVPHQRGWFWWWFVPSVLRGSPTPSWSLAVAIGGALWGLDRALLASGLLGDVRGWAVAMVVVWWRLHAGWVYASTREVTWWGSSPEKGVEWVLAHAFAQYRGEGVGVGLLLLIVNVIVATWTWSHRDEGGGVDEEIDEDEDEEEEEEEDEGEAGQEGREGEHQREIYGDQKVGRHRPQHRGRKKHAQQSRTAEPGLEARWKMKKKPPTPSPSVLSSPPHVPVVVRLLMPSVALFILWTLVETAHWKFESPLYTYLWNSSS